MLLAAFAAVFAFPVAAHAETACSKVSIEIAQELTLERIAFDAKLVITNNMPDKNLTDLDVDILIRDAEGNEQGEKFFIALPTFRNITDVSGSGVVPAGQQSEVHWLIIPSPGAGGMDPAGQQYWVGATLSYTIEGHEEVITVNPDRITVRPEAQLVLDYFTPYKVVGDNPFTPVVEPPVPFPLAVRVLNDGYGPAWSLKIDSAQPKITENSKGLLVDFQLLGAAVNDSAVDPSLNVDLGNLESKSIATAYWEMISTLSGKFIEFDVSFTHDAALGGELTSLIRETNSYYFVHHVKVNLPGRDGRLDILADVDEDEGRYPDTIFESEIPGDSTLASDSLSSVAVVNTVSVSGRPTALSSEVEIVLDVFDAGWIYTRIPDPGNGMLRVLRVLRYDGVEVDTNNFWISREFDDNYKETNTFHLLDYRVNESVPGKYRLIYEQPTEDLEPPVSRLQFNGPGIEAERIYIAPETNIIFLASDNDGGSGVEQVLRQVLGVDTAFIPAYPLHITQTGEADLEFYSVDRAGNQEPINTAYLFIDDSAPVISRYEAVPSSFSPHAPRGVVTAKESAFHIAGEDAVPYLIGMVKIARGESFDEEQVIRTYEINPETGKEVAVYWNGRDKDNVLMPSGIYTARLTLSDGLDWETLDHTTSVDIQVEIDEWFKGQPVDPNLSAAQMYPHVSGGVVVWQDRRNGNWDIYMRDVTGTDNSEALTDESADQISPSVEGSTVVWQDRRSGNWDIYGYDLTNESEITVSTASGNQERPVVSGSWVAWQDDSAGNWDIYAYNTGTSELIQITSHERDQINPALSGNVLTWEDYRHGLGEIYTYDLNTRTEQRRTYNIYTQTYPSVSGDTLVWTDRRSGQRDIYYLTADIPETRMTYGVGDHSQSSVSGALVVYTNYETGLDDPNLSFYHITAGIGAQLTSNPASQEEPSVVTPWIVWQDNRDGVYQAYWAELNIEELPLEVELKPGFNLISVGAGMVDTYASSDSLIAADFGIEKVVTQNSLNGIYLESSVDVDIALNKGMGIGVYATRGGSIPVASSGETAEYSLLPGLNYIGMLTVRPGYTAHELIRSVGTANIQSVQRYDTATGSWETAAVKDVDGNIEIVGPDFTINAGEGLVITMKKRVDGWRP